MALSWKQFNFFDLTQVNPPDASLFESSSLSSVTSGSESLFLGTPDGKVHILNSSLKAVRTFTAYQAAAGPVTQLKQVPGTSLLVTIAENLSDEPLLKVWALDSIDKKTQSPKCLSELRIQNQRKPFPISAFAALDDLSQLAVGFANGSVTVVRGDLIHDRGAKQRTIFESDEPITGVAFRERSRTTTLFLATTGRILTLTISGKGQGTPAKPLEDIGCGADCMTVDRKSGEVIVVREDAIYYYGVNGRGPSIAYEGPKQLVRMFGEYVCVVQPPSAPQNDRRFFGQAEEYLNASTFTLVDADLRYVAHKETISSKVHTVFTEWGDLWVLSMDGKLYRYHEKTLQQKLEILYDRNLYVLAIDLAQKAHLDISQRNIILRRYGDYLYQKGDYDTAMQQYLKAIDNTEPSQVIRKFLDTQRIHNLIEYLEELHEHDKASVDHTTLLLNCYAKLKDTAKLESFIKGGNNFDFDTAITMCRQGGYFEQACFLAKKHGEHALVVDILVEDSKKYEEALNYIWKQEPAIAYANLMKYARVFLEHCSTDTTQLFIDYYTGEYRIRQETTRQPQLVPSGSGHTIPGLASFIPLAYRNTSSTASPGSQGAQQQQQKLEGAEAAEAAAAAPPLEYEVPKPRTAFSSFVDHADEFITFLEACLKQEHVSEADKADLYTALFEMYLEQSKRRGAGERQQWEDKARALIDSKKVPIDPSNILLISHLSSFKDGTTMVREQQGLRTDIFRSYTTAKDTAGAIKALHKYGPEEPSLYPAALAYFTSSPEILAEAGPELDAVLQKIDTDNLLAPLQVVQMLGKNQVASVGLVRRYLTDSIERERKEIDSNKRLAESYRASTQGKREELHALNKAPVSIQNRRCASCGSSLDLPAVHYLCKHSFHQKCLNVSSTAARQGQQQQQQQQQAGEGDDGSPPRPECPVCEKENEMVRAMRRAQLDMAGRHEMFLDVMGRSKDGMATVSEFFGRGVMGS